MRDSHPSERFAETVDGSHQPGLRVDCPAFRIHKDSDVSADAAVAAEFTTFVIERFAAGPVPGRMSVGILPLQQHIAVRPAFSEQMLKFHPFIIGRSGQSHVFARLSSMVCAWETLRFAFWFEKAGVAKIRVHLPEPVLLRQSQHPGTDPACLLCLSEAPLAEIQVPARVPAIVRVRHHWGRPPKRPDADP